MRLRFASKVCLVVVLAGCASRQEQGPETPDQFVREMPPASEIRNLRTGETVSEQELLSDLLSARVVYLGESHDETMDHAMQYRLLRLLYAQDPALAVGMEMFQEPFQPALDLWSRGELDEVALRTRTEWDDRWGFDIRHYRPLLEMVRAHGIPFWALNAPRELTRAVARGGFEGLTDEQRAQLPEHLGIDDAAHRAMFNEAMADHPHAHDAAALDRLYHAQVVWDATMARNVGRGLAAGASRMVVLAGSMHVRAGLGIPKRAESSGGRPYRVVLPVDADDADAIEALEEADPRPADYLWIWSD